MSTATYRVPACMGGWCGIRNQCARYHQQHDRKDPAERLCSPGWAPMFLPLGDRPARTWALPLSSPPPSPLYRPWENPL